MEIRIDFGRRSVCTVHMKEIKNQNETTTHGIFFGEGLNTYLFSLLFLTYDTGLTTTGFD